MRKNADGPKRGEGGKSTRMADSAHQARRQPAADEKAKEMGIRAFLLKPMLKGVMAETVRRVLDDKH